MRLSNGEVLLRWPLSTHIITAGWTYNDGSAHNAIDLRAAVGTPVYAAEDGTVDQVQAWDGHSISGKVDLNRDYHHYIASTGAPAEEQPATPELHKLSISLPGADADKAAEIIRKAADLGLAPDVTVETLPASAGDIKTLTEMADAAGGVAAKV